MEKKLHLSILVLLGSFQSSVNFLTWPSSLGWGADKRATAYQVKRLQFNSAASCTIFGWTEYVLLWNVVKVTIKKLSIRIWIHIILCAQSGIVHHLVFWKEKLLIAQELFFWEIWCAACESPQILWGKLLLWCVLQFSGLMQGEKEPCNSSQTWALRCWGSQGGADGLVQSRSSWSAAHCGLKKL